ncbi:hypothetical protein BCR44DRAFT_1432675 [Catenaria anguillulae PL171]|uniref:Uncharacterized protein n=1 Tax=Catenaria anguillulae PL171 TaxID=765915 RepID=A0A1Y2HPC7_9FUNG|nr:hypothetical protein BCR44DRAFT_1432675 [Catenaria anguillulae PL171]
MAKKKTSRSSAEITMQVVAAYSTWPSVQSSLHFPLPKGLSGRLERGQLELLSP